MPVRPTLFTPARPTFEIDGVAAKDLDRELVELDLVERTGARARCTARFANWGDTGRGPGYLHFADPRLAFGRTLVVKLGTQRLFQGSIGALEGRYLEGAPATIVCEAEAAAPPQGATGPAVRLAFGAGLRSCTARTAPAPSAPTVTVAGIAECDARLRLGASVEFAGLGPTFDGVRLIDGVRHRFDDKGLRTEFTAGTAPEAPPASEDDSVPVHRIESGGQARFVIGTPDQRELRFEFVAGLLTLADGNGTQVRLDATGITIQTAAKVALAASAIELSAGMVTVNAGMVRFSNVVQADTVIANSIIAQSYTPGAGNIL